MKNLFTFLALVLATNGMAIAQTAVDNRDVRDTINAQIDAFRQKDPASAFAFASPFIQRQFGSPENFAAMVRGGYPMVWDPGDVQMLEQVENGNTVWQKVRFRDKSGMDHWFAYEVIQCNGHWRINGVYKIKGPDLAV